MEIMGQSIRNFIIQHLVLCPVVSQSYLTIRIGLEHALPFRVHFSLTVTAM